MDTVTPIAAGQGIGARVSRKEDDRLLRGRGRFIGDMAMAGLREVAFLRSPVAHARIRGIAKPAGAEDKVFVRGDLVSVRPVRSVLRLPGFKASDCPPLAQGKVRFVGEAVAMCIAETRARAEDLAEMVDLDLDVLPAIADVDAALANTARVHDEWADNLYLTTLIDADLSAVAAGAAVTVTREYRCARQVMNPLEGKAVLAYWDDRADQLVVYTSTQVPHMIRWALAEHLGIEQRRVRVVAPDVGGGFGYKCVLHPEELCIAWLALTYRKPFRWTEDRREHLVAGANCREHRYRVTAYADARGKLLGLDAEILIDAGAYSVWPFTACLEGTMAAGHLPGPYVVPAYRARSLSVATNKPAIIPYRGVARTGICFAMELTIDAIAREIGREAWEVRRENLVPQSAMPYRNATGKVYDSGDYARGLEMAVEAIGLEGVRTRQATGERDGRLIGFGTASYIEMTAHGTALFAALGLPFVPGYEQATVRFTPDGGLELRVGVQSHGQGMETSLAQLAHEVLGVDLAHISVMHGDTAFSPFSTGTYASRSITMAGGAVVRACRALLPRLQAIAAHVLKSEGEPPLVDGHFIGPDGRIAVGEVARTFYLRPHELPPSAHSGGLEVTEGFKPKVDTGQYSYGTHAVVVAIDPSVGGVEILDYVIVEDCGTVVNPLIVEGQAYGGAAQGIGTALFEEMAFDANAQPLGSTLADYMLPGAGEVPRIRLLHLTTPSPNTEYGIKGAGEGGAIPPPAAILNAVNDALRPLGAEVGETPLTPRRLLAALAGSRKA
jgi:aerobic carbon-monoxide dehydrogenase large subunit